MPSLATKPQAICFEDGAKGKQAELSAGFDFFSCDVEHLQAALQAANTVLLGEIGELKKNISNERRRFELKEVHYHRAQLVPKARKQHLFSVRQKELFQR
jgi:hypothetical protein